MTNVTLPVVAHTDRTVSSSAVTMQQVLLLGSFALTCLAWVLVLPFLVGWCRVTVSDCFFPLVSLAYGPILIAAP